MPQNPIDYDDSKSIIHINRVGTNSFDTQSNSLRVTRVSGSDTYAVITISFDVATNTEKWVYYRDALKTEILDTVTYMPGFRTGVPNGDITKVQGV